MSHSNLKPVDDIAAPPLGEVAISSRRRDDPFANYFADRPVLEAIDSTGSIFLNPDPVVQDEGGSLGLGVYDRMLADDAHMRGQWERRVNACVGLGFEIIEAGDDPEHMADAEFARDVIAAIEEFDETRKRWMKHRLKGYGVAELVWQTDGTNLYIEKVKIHDPRTFVFGAPAGELRVVRGPDPRDSEPVDMRKFLVGRTGGDAWNPYGVGLGQTLYYLGLYKKHAINNWHTLSEKHATPTMEAIYKAGLNINKFDALEVAEEATTQQAVAHDDAIELKPINVAGATNATVHNDQISRLNDEISVAITGQVLSGNPQSTGIGNGQATLAADVTQNILDADALDQESFINAIIRLVIIFNRGGRAPNSYPRAVIKTENEENQTEEANTIDILVRAGVPIAVADVQKKFGLRAPKPGEAVLEPSGSLVTSGIGSGGPEGPTGGDPGKPAQFSEGARLIDEGDDAIARANASVVRKMVARFTEAIDGLQRLLLGDALGKRRGTR